MSMTIAFLKNKFVVMSFKNIGITSLSPCRQGIRYELMQCDLVEGPPCAPCQGDVLQLLVTAGAVRVIPVNGPFRIIVAAPGNLSLRPPLSFSNGAPVCARSSRTQARCIDIPVRPTNRRRECIPRHHYLPSTAVMLLLRALSLAIAWTAPGTMSLYYNHESAGLDIAKHTLDVHYFKLYTESESGVENKDQLEYVRHIHSAWAEIIPRYQSSLEARLEVESNLVEGQRHCTETWRHARMCLVHIAPLEMDRSCLLDPSMLTAPELVVTAFAGPFVSPAAFRQFFLDRLGFALGSIKGMNITISERYTVHSSHQECSRVSAEDLNASHFLKEYMIPQRPVVITEAFSAPPLEQIYNILQAHRHTRVGAKLSPNEDFEGIEELSAWQGGEAQRVPPHVLSRLQSPDLLVVRNAHKELTVQEVLAMLAARGRNKEYNQSATNVYVEYLDMLHDPQLHQLYADVMGEAGLPDWAQYFYEAYYDSIRTKNSDLIIQSHAGAEAGEVKPMLWLGDGRTVGKLHFDPFDNILYQVQGKKRFRLSDPERNERFYEGHMREAILEAVEASDGPSTLGGEGSGNGVCALTETAAACDPLRPHRYIFRKQRLLESTSMVHSPVDISLPLHKHYPLANSVQYMDCEVGPGEALFVPSYWWHEVASQPSEEAIHDISLNLAINFWFEPLYSKSFPCASCRKKLNVRQYEDVLNAAAARGLL